MGWDWFHGWGWFRGWSWFLGRFRCWFRGRWLWDDDFLRNDNAGGFQVGLKWVVLCRLVLFLGLMRMLDRDHRTLIFRIGVVIIFLVRAVGIVSALKCSDRHFVNF